MTQNKAVPFYDYDYENGKTHIGNSFLRTTTAKVTTPAGSFTNVVHIEQTYVQFISTLHQATV